MCMDHLAGCRSLMRGHDRLQVKRMLYYQLPPHGFWFYLCNGLQVYDALIVATWMVINVINVEQKRSLMLSGYRGELTSTFELMYWCCLPARVHMPGKQRDAVCAVSLRGAIAVTVPATCQQRHRCISGGAILIPLPSIAGSPTLRSLLTGLSLSAAQHLGRVWLGGNAGHHDALLPRSKELIPALLAGRRLHLPDKVPQVCGGQHCRSL